MLFCSVVVLQGYVAEGLDLGPSFDPEDSTDHRYQYVIGDNAVSIMPTLDYYGYEHEDAITGVWRLMVCLSKGLNPQPANPKSHHKATATCCD
jgi:hypothetical protein